MSDNRDAGGGPADARLRRQRGLALLAVLWLVTLLSVIAASFAATSRTGAQLARNAVEKAKAEALADAGVYRAVLGLLEPDPDRRWRTDGAVYALALGGGEIDVSVQDEAGRIDLNVAADELLHGLFLYAGLGEAGAAALVDAVADFRDPDDLGRPNGAEDADYGAAGLPHGAKDAAFEAVEELQQVLGMTPEIYRRIAPLVTVHSWQDGLDPLTAPPEVLAALPGIEPARVEAILQARAGSARGLDPAEFAGGAAVAPRPARPRRPERAPEWDVTADASFAEYQALLTGFGGAVFSVRAAARTATGAVFVRDAVVAVDAAGGAGEPYTFYSWKRGEAAVAAD